MWMNPRFNICSICQSHFCLSPSNIGEKSPFFTAAVLSIGRKDSKIQIIPLSLSVQFCPLRYG